jgi:hypothetical protein
MEDIKLTAEEKKELEKRGFLIKDNYSLLKYIYHLRYLIVILTWCSIPSAFGIFFFLPVLMNIFPFITGSSHVFTCIFIGALLI